MTKRAILLSATSVIISVGLIGSVGFAASRYLTSPPEVLRVNNCHTLGIHHSVTIASGNVRPSMTYATLCDTLTIINQDNRLRLIAFGAHDHHEAYDGITTQLLGQNQSLTVTLNSTGTYTFHDHLDDSAVGYFTVAK